MFGQVDRRDRFLVLIGALALLLGYAYSVAKVPRGVRSSLSTALHIAPLWVYGMAWLAAGVYCIAAAVTRRVNGFPIASATPTLWGSVYIIGWLHGDPGRGWVTAGIFYALAGAVYCVAGLVDPDPITSRKVADES